MADGRTPAKRMRKGTRSCLQCRRRKAKCIFNPQHSSSCTECTARDLECIPQGIVVDDNDSRNLALRSRVNELEDLVRRLIANGNVPSPELPEVMHSGRPARSVTRETSTPLLSSNGGAVEPDEGIVESTTAPLMRLFRSSALSGHPLASPRPNGETASSQARVESIRSEKYHMAVKELIAALPDEREMLDIVVHKSSWWPLWRDTVGLKWGDQQSNALQDFAEFVLEDGSPGLLGTLLVSCAISTGRLKTYLAPVERHILDDDTLAGTEHGLSCLMALGVCYMNHLQPRRAWNVYRRANTIMQLNGLHVTHRRTKKQEDLFWLLYHADRWTSLAIGLPYLLQDSFCDLYIPPVDDMPVQLWLYRHLAIVTGHVIDGLQKSKGPNLAAAIAVDDEIMELLAQVPERYLDPEDIRVCTDKAEKHTRLYRAVHVHQLRAYVHLPFFLSTSSRTQTRYRYSRQICTEEATNLVRSYLDLFDSDPAAAADGGVINFHAFVAATIVVLSLLGYGEHDRHDLSKPSEHAAEWALVSRVTEALARGERGIASAMCRQLREALESLVHHLRDADSNEPRTIVLPYFGSIVVSRKQQAGANASEQDQTRSTSGNQTKSARKRRRRTMVEDAAPRSSDLSPPSLERSPTTQALLAADNLPGSSEFSLAYHGPYVPEMPSQTPWQSGQEHASGMPLFPDTFNYMWHDSSMQLTEELGWLGMDLPPNMNF